MIYCSDKPYPIPRVEKENLDYAKILSQSFAGNTSEETAIHLYLYQNFVAADDRIRKIMKKIAVVEMRHLDLLGETIKLLGLPPKFETYNSENGDPTPWTSSNVNYNSDLKQMLEIDIASETMAIQNYEIQKVVIQDHYIRELLDRIIEDEYIHLNIFIDLYNEISLKK